MLRVFFNLVVVSVNLLSSVPASVSTLFRNRTPYTRIKNSRFIANIGHTPTIESAKGFVASMKALALSM